MASSKGNEEKKVKSMQKSYFDVLGLCCSSEVPLIEKILKGLEGVVEVSVIVPSRTVIVVHDTNLISQEQIVKALNQARLEANVRVIGKVNYRARWPSPYVMLSGLLLSLSLLKYVYHPLQYLALAAVAVGVWPILMRGVVAIRNFTLDVNILVLIAVGSTIAMRDYLEAGTIVFLFTIAEWLESRASQKATAVMSSLLSMAPQKATIAETGEVVNVEDVKLNTVIAVKAGEIIPVDGMVVVGTCEVDEKTLTGESYPVPKQKDSNVWAGTVNVNGYINVKTTALAEDCAVAKMARLVEEAQNSRSSVQRLIDKCARFYTPAVVLMSAGLAVVPAIMKLHNLRHWFYLALVVLVSACPCGLILSTPVATFCALSRAATTGLLIKGGDYLEILAKIKVMAFDKTGTITRGEFTLTNFLTLADDVSLSTLLYWVSSIETKSSHPISSVLVGYGRSQSIEPKPENVEDFQNFPGEGVFGKIDGREIYIGNKKLGQRAKCTVASDNGGDAKEGRSPGYVYSGGALIGTFSLTDNCRSGAIDAIKELKAMGIRTAMLTGDGQSAAMHAQEQLGGALDVVHAELLPEEKARIIKDYKKEGPTAMVGDGVNDAPALATADIGISMGVSGSALATETGHVILMSNDIRKIPKAIKLARKTRRKVIENIIFSIITKAGVLAFAFAWHPLVWLAVLVDVATCLIVILNSMLLLRGGHAHGRKWLGLFSCHSHKSKCHSTGQHAKMDNKCCSKSAAPKTCESAKCSSEKFPSSCQTSSKCHTTCQPSSMKNCESARCSSLNLSASCQTSSKCHSTDSLNLSTKTQHCSPNFGSEKVFESSECHAQNCASSCRTSKRVDSSCQPHRHVHDSHEKHCSDASPTASKSLQSSSSACAGSLCDPSNTHRKDDSTQYHHSTCCQEDHCLDSLESQISCGGIETSDKGTRCDSGSCEAVQHETIPECHHKHSDHCHSSSESEHHLVEIKHHHEQKTCFEGIDGNKTSCGLAKQNISAHCKSDGLLHNEKNVSMCKDLCKRSPEFHEVHHCFVSQHAMCHTDTNAKDACTRLRTRDAGACCKSFRKECCSSQGHFVAGFGGLTEIVTE